MRTFARSSARNATRFWLPLLAALVAAAPAHAATPITDCATTAGVRAAVAAGGAHEFTCHGNIFFSATEPEIVVNKPVVIDGRGIGIYIYGRRGNPDWRQGRLFKVVAGSLELKGITRIEGGADHHPALTDPTYQPGTFGMSGAPGTPGVTPPVEAKGASGTSGGPGASAKDAPSVPVVRGGCFYVSKATSLVLRDLTIANCWVRGKFGGGGGAGGHGGTGGSGMYGEDGPEGADGFTGGAGGAGGPAGHGGDGAHGSNGHGGAIYNAGVLVVRDVRFQYNRAFGGDAGSGSNGGWGGGGGDGGNGGVGGIAPVGGQAGSGGRGGDGGHGDVAGHSGDGGDGGDGKGGAIYNAGRISIDGATFDTNDAEGGMAGYGGLGGHGGRGGRGGSGSPPGSIGGCQAGCGLYGPPGAGGRGDNGGNAGHGGDWGDGRGGAIFYRYTPRQGELPTNSTMKGSDARPGRQPFPDNKGFAGGGGAGGVSGQNTPGPSGVDGLPGTNGTAGFGADPDMAIGGARPEHKTQEGDKDTFRLKFTAKIEDPQPAPVAVTYHTEDETAKASDNDYRAVSDTVTFLPGETEKTFVVEVVGDTAREPDQIFSVVLSADEDVTIADPELIGKIINDDPIPQMAVLDTAVNRPQGNTGSNAVFGVLLKNPTDNTITVKYTTADGTAKAGQDYDARSGVLTIPPRAPAATVAVPIRPDPRETENDSQDFSLVLSEPAHATLARARAKATIVTKRFLEVTIKPPKTIKVEHTVKGPTPETFKVTVTAKNTGTKAMTNVTVPKTLSRSWAPGSGGAGTLRLKQTAAPSDLTIGTLNGGQKASRVYTLQAKGDADVVLKAVVTAVKNGQTIATEGTRRQEITSDLLVFDAKLGAKIVSPKSSRLVMAGTPYLVTLNLENRSTYRRLVIPPYYADLSGNAGGGHVTDLAGALESVLNATGSMKEVQSSPSLLIRPKKKRKVYIFVRTSHSDESAFEGEPNFKGGGTRSQVSLELPEIKTLTADNKLKNQSTKLVIRTEDSDKFQVSLDDSGPEPPSFGLIENLETTGYFAKGVAIGLAKVTWGAVRGIAWDFPKLVVNGVVWANTSTIWYLHHQYELYKAMQADPDLKGQYLGLLVAKVSETFEETPTLLPAKASELYQQVDKAVANHYRKLNREWFVGDWRGAAEAFTTENVEGVVGVVTTLGPGVLARMPRLQSRLSALRNRSLQVVGQQLAAVVTKVRPSAAEALAALRYVMKPGFIFDEAQLAKIYGLRPVEARWLAEFTKKHRIALTFRSRAAESIKWIEERGAVLKPFWIKLKNVNWTDVEYLGYHADDVGRLIVRRPPSWEQVAAKLRAQGLKPDSVAWKEVQGRWRSRLDEFHGKEVRDMHKWHDDGVVDGKWPWLENGVDPALQADETFAAGFRLQRIPGRPGEFAPQIYNPKTKQWASVTGDIDLIAITKADGTALSDAQHVAILKEIREGPMGALHPESATWIKGGKWWFKAKENYLANANDVTGAAECCLAQYGSDGVPRAVMWNKRLSDVERRDKHTYRLWFDGAHIPAPGLKSPRRVSTK